MTKPFSLSLPDVCVRDLYRQNPWWEGNPLPSLPQFKRWPFAKILNRLRAPIAPILIIRGPRQIGKTTLQQQIVAELLSEGVKARRIFRVQFDDLPSFAHIDSNEELILRLVDWFEDQILESNLNESVRRGEPAFLFFDEVQNLSSWDAQLKSLVDHVTVRVLVTGSSALRIELGRDSLAGRIQTLEVGPLRLAEIAALRGFGELKTAQPDNGWEEWLHPEFWNHLRDLGAQQAKIRDAAYTAFSERGAYPVAQINPNVAWPEIADQLTETVINRVIQHDLRIGERGRNRDQKLLEEVFRMACRYLGQAPNPATLAQEVHITLNANVGPQRIRHYLDFLDSSLLIRAIQPLEIRMKKRKSYSKLCLCDHALRAAWLQEIIPLDPQALDRQPHLSDLAGHVAESVTGYYLASLTGLDVAYKPEYQDDPEVDFVLTIGEKRIPIEIKYRRIIDPLRDTLGLRLFLEKANNNAPFGLLVTRDDATVINDPRIVCLPLKSLLMVR
ncbi:MAG: AAA family ATPase [Planctomycetota bacterium]